MWMIRSMAWWTFSVAKGFGRLEWAQIKVLRRVRASWQPRAWMVARPGWQMKE